MSVILDIGHYQNDKNGNYNSWSQHRDLQPKLNPTKFGSIFNFNKMSALLDFSHYQNHKNGNYNSWSQHRDLQPKQNPTKFGSIKLNHQQHTKPSRTHRTEP